MDPKGAGDIRHGLVVGKRHNTLSKSKVGERPWPRLLPHSILSLAILPSRIHRGQTRILPLLPNATRQARLKAGARHERTLAGFGCTRLFGRATAPSPWTGGDTLPCLAAADSCT